MSINGYNIGGDRGFSKVIWTVKEKGGGDFPYITLYYHSFDGEEGTYYFFTSTSSIISVNLHFF